MKSGDPAPPRPDSEVRTLVERALHGVDRPLAHQSVGWIFAAKMPPKRLRPHPRATPPSQPRRSFGQRVVAGLAGSLSWITDPFQWMGDWVYLFKSREERIQQKRLKGGWDSLAGRLMSKNCAAVPHALVVGERTLSLVYVGQTEAEIAWSVPKEQLTGVQVADWDVTNEQKVTWRCHFTDASWADLKAFGPGWERFLEYLPRQ